MENVNIYERLGAVVKRHLKGFKEDWDLDREELERYAGTGISFVWFCRETGTELLTESNLDNWESWASKVVRYHGWEHPEKIHGAAVVRPWTVRTENGVKAVYGDVTRVSFEKLYKRAGGDIIKAKNGSGR